MATKENELLLAEIYQVENGYIIVDENGKTHVSLKTADITKTIDSIIQTKKRKKLMERELPAEYIDDPLVDED